MKKFIACLLALMMLAGMAGCTKGGESKQPTSSTPQSNAASDTKDAFNATGLPIVNEPTTLKVLTKNQPGTVAFTETGDAPVWKAITKYTGITFDVESYDSDDLASKLSLILSTDAHPDIYWQCWYQAQDLMGYGSQGKLLALDDYIERYGENLKEAFETIDGCKATVTMPDGHIYGYPSIWASEGYASVSVNDKWMKACGVNAYPTTLDELYDMLKKFKTSDANGNGDPNDEIPVSGQDFASVFFDYVLAAEGLLAYGGYDSAQASFDLKNDKVFPIYTDDRYKTAIAFMHQLYAEELVDKNYLTETGDEFDSKRLNNLTGIIATTHPTVDEKYDPADYTVLAPVTSKDNSEKIVAAYSVVSLGGAAIDANTKNKEVAVRFLDYSLSKDGSALWGALCNLYNYNGVSDEIVAMLKPYENDTHSEFTGMYGCMWNRAEWKLPSTNHIQKTGDENKLPFAKVNFAQNIAFTNEESEVISTYKSELDSYIKDRVSNWIIGKENLDAGWADFVKNCNSMGTDKLVAVYQSAYDRIK